MIQRIQTVYLLLVVCLCLLTLFFPLAELISEQNSVYEFTPFSVSELSGTSDYNYATYSLSVLLSLVAIIAFAEIFLYKKRILQMRMSSFSILLLIGFYLLFAFYAFTVKRYLAADLHLRFVIGLPAICIILEYLAIRAIGKDEALIRSLNRLR